MPQPHHGMTTGGPPGYGVAYLEYSLSASSVRRCLCASSACNFNSSSSPSVSSAADAAADTSGAGGTLGAASSPAAPAAPAASSLPNSPLLLLPLV